MDSLSYDLREFKIFCIDFGVKASVAAFNEWIRCYRVILVIIICSVWVLEHHSVATTKQIFITCTTWFFYDVWRMVRYWCTSVVHWNGLLVIICERCGTCIHSTSWLIKPFAKPELVKERKALVKLTLEFFLRRWKMRKSDFGENHISCGKAFFKWTTFISLQTHIVNSVNKWIVTGVRHC